MKLGAFGESWAAGYLTRLGYLIVDRNVRFRAGEIDLIAYDGPELVFIEVKTRRSRAYGSPQSSIDARRYAHLAAAIESYLQSRNLEPESYRIDVVAIELGKDGRVKNCELLKAVEVPR